MKKSYNKKKVYFSCAILVFIILIVAVGGYCFVSTKSKAKDVFTSTIDKAFEKITSQDNLSSIAGDISIKTNLSSDDKSIEKMLDIVNNLDADIKYGIDYNTNNLNIVSKARYNQEELINISSYIENNELFINLNDIYNKTINIPIKKHNNYVSTIFNQNDMKIIAKQLNKAINNSLKDEYFIKKNTNIILNDNDTKVTKNTLTLNNTNLDKIINSIKEELGNNDEFLGSLSQISNETKEEIKSRIASINNNYIEEIITISLYTKENKVIGLEIAKTFSTGLSLLILKNTETNYSYEIKNNVNSYKGNFEIKKGDNSINLKISINGTINGTISIDINYDKNKYINEFVKKDIVKIENITDEERLEMFDNIQKKISIRSLIKNLWNLIEL